MRLKRLQRFSENPRPRIYSNRGLWSYLRQRALLGLASLIVATFGTFIALRIAPGDPIALMFGGRPVDPALAAALRVRYGFDRSVVVQYLIFIRNALEGDFGLSYYYDGHPVSELLVPAFTTTVQWQIPALLFAIAIALSLGVVTANPRNAWFSAAIDLIFMIGISLPEFAVAAIFVLIFSQRLQLLPVAGVSSPCYFILPAMTITVSLCAVLSQVLRNEIGDELRKDYIRTARAKGLSERRVLTNHALPNAIQPFLPVVGAQVGRCIGGAFLIETIFNIPGVGRLAIEGVLHRDYPVVLAVTTLMSVAFIVSNLAVDLLAGVLNPRMSLVGTGH